MIIIIKTEDKIRRARETMKELDLDMLLMVGRENLIYFTGLTQIECMAMLIPREGEACAVTIWLDVAYVREGSGLKTYGYVFPKESLVSNVVERIQEYGLVKPRIGFERYFVDFAMFDGLRTAFPKAAFISAANLFYNVRSIKDEQEIACIRRAAAAVCRGMEAAIKAIRPGVSELDILA